MGEKGAHIWNI